MRVNNSGLLFVGLNDMTALYFSYFIETRTSALTYVTLENPI